MNLFSILSIIEKMEQNKKKTFIIEINGVKESIENIENLIDSLDKLELKVKNSNTSKAVAATFDNFTQSLTNIESLLKNIVATIGKVKPLIEVTIQAININKEAKKTEEAKEGIPGLNKSLSQIELDPKKDTTPKTDPIKNNDNTTDVDATRALIEISKKEIENYQKILEETDIASKEFFSKEEARYKGLFGDHLDTLVNLDKESDEYKKLSKEQQGELEKYKKFLNDKDQYNKNYLTKKNAVQTLEDKLQITSNSVMLKGLRKTLDQMKLQWDKYGTQVQAVTTGIQEHMAASAALYKAQAEEVGKLLTATDEKLKASTEKRKALDEEAKTATAGRLLVIEEQKAREIAASEELTMQKKEQEAEKARLEKEAEKREKRAQRLKLAMSIPKAIADIAAGVSAALSMGPLGIAMGAMLAAQGAIQIATIRKQYEKINMEDGGLLRGKRHAQGGMRIEGSNIEVEGDEFVVNRISTRRNLGLIDYINRERRELTAEDLNGYFGRSKSLPRIESKRMYETGGQLTNLEVVDAASSPEINKILETISKIDFRPVVSVVDIADAQRTMVSVQNSANI